MKRIYYTTKNNGDGSSSVWFFTKHDCIMMLEERDPETFAGGEGGGSFLVDGEISGIKVRDEVDVMCYLDDLNL